VPAFEAWLASDPLHDRNAPASPLLVPEYHIANFEHADRLEANAAEHFVGGEEATERADQYVLVTVFLAAVLFFAGISLRFAWWPMRVSIVALGVVFLVIAVIRILGLPAR
jgi:hypothetical protein